MIGNPSIFKIYVVKFVEFLGPNITYFENIINESELFSKMGDVRTRFGSLSQKMDGLRPKKPKTMNLLRVGWKTGLK